jgi:hypothetical protein
MKLLPGARMAIFCVMMWPAFAAAGQVSNSNGQAGASGAQTSEQSSGGTPAATSQDSTDKSKKKPKKVWTNDEISSAGGEGSISVVGNGEPNGKGSGTDHSEKGNGSFSSSPTRERQVAVYRDRLRQLRIQLETTDKKISDLRNFKADNTSASGGINMRQGYSMTPVQDQIKQLEEKKKQLQAQIDNVEDQARKSGVEPGELR